VSENGQIPLLLIHGAWLSARSWENYADYFGGRGFAVSVPEWPRSGGPGHTMSAESVICDVFVSMRI
jgi:pimeloyl-ACP methyl ester carboxylesterase